MKPKHIVIGGTVIGVSALGIALAKRKKEEEEPLWVRELPVGGSIAWPIYDAKLHGEPHYDPSKVPGDPNRPGLGGTYDWADAIQFYIYTIWVPASPWMLYLGSAIYAGSAAMGTGTDIRQQDPGLWFEKSGTHTFFSMHPGKTITMKRGWGTSRIVVSLLEDGTVRLEAYPSVYVTKEWCVMQEGPGLVS